MNKNNLHNYQKYAVDFILDHPYAGLFLDMGLGKTVSTLTALDKLMYEDFEINRVLLVAPKWVATSTWSEEIEKWEHIRHLRISKILGSEKQRKAALKEKADIYIINRENVSWLVAYFRGSLPFDMLVIDELSSFKSPKAQRFKALRLVRPCFKRVVGLTGTPAPNGLIDLWGQLYLLDMGERLEETVTNYRRKYFNPGKRNGQVVFNYKIQKGAEKVIYNKISDICMSMKSEDYLELPDCTNITTSVILSDDEMSEYIHFEKTEVLKIFEEEEENSISVVNAAALSNKLLQYSNGAVYDDDRRVHEIHNAKLDALEGIIESANGESVLVFYSFRHDLYRVQERLKSYNPRVLSEKKDIEDWNSGKIKVLLLHPASAGHGLNLQKGGHIAVWFGLTWSLEMYQQACARLHRQGQTKPVFIYHLVTKGTIDEDVVAAITGKADKQAALMKAIKARIKKYREK